MTLARPDGIGVPTGATPKKSVGMAGGELPLGCPNATIGPVVAPTEFNQSTNRLAAYAIVCCWPEADDLGVAPSRQLSEVSPTARN
jgi:hypothetical protein